MAKRIKLTAWILIPAWREVALRPAFPVSLATLPEIGCSHRGLPPCIQKDGGIITPPPKAGVGRVMFNTPNGTQRFEATLTHYSLSDCNGPNGDWTGQVFADEKLLDQWHMLGVGSRVVSITIPNGAKRLELRGIDNNNSEWCDDTIWRGAMFTD